MSEVVFWWGHWSVGGDFPRVEVAGEHDVFTHSHDKSESLNCMVKMSVSEGVFYGMTASIS